MNHRTRLVFLAAVVVGTFLGILLPHAQDAEAKTVAPAQCVSEGGCVYVTQKQLDTFIKQQAERWMEENYADCASWS